MRTSTPSGTESTVGREVQDARDAGGDEPVADVLGGEGRRGDHADRDMLARATIVLEVVERPDVQSPTASPTRAGSLSSRATIRKPREEKPL